IYGGWQAVVESKREEVGGWAHQPRCEVLLERGLDFQQIVGMGKVIVTIKLTNFSDLVLHSRRFSKRKPRQLEVESLVDTGATRLYLKPSVIKKLGLQRTDAVRSMTT